MEPLSTDDAVAQIHVIIRRWLLSSPSRADARRMAITLDQEASALSRVVDYFPDHASSISASC
jgi:hypothetical protein